MSSYALERVNRFQHAICAITASELQPQNTVTLMSEVDLSDVEELRALAGSGKPSYTAFVLKAVALALQEFPFANRRLVKLPFLGRRVQAFSGIDVAVLCERDLPEAPMLAFVDVIRSANRLPLSEINRQLHQLAACTTENNTQWRQFSWIITHLPKWLAQRVIALPTWFPDMWAKYRGGAISISSPAKYGVDAIVATWSWPLGISFGLVKERAVVRSGQLSVRPTFTLTLNFDRRLLAGAQAAKFFKRAVAVLENATAEMRENDKSATETLKGEPGSQLNRVITGMAAAEESAQCSVGADARTEASTCIKV